MPTRCTWPWIRLHSSTVYSRTTLLVHISLLFNYAKTRIDKAIHWKYARLRNYTKTYIGKTVLHYNSHIPPSYGRDIPYGMHGRWSNRSPIINHQKTHPWSVEGIQISDLYSDAIPATLARSCLAVIAPQYSKGCTPVNQVSYWGQSTSAGMIDDRFFDSDKSVVLALVAYTPEMRANVTQLLLPITLPFLRDLTLYGGVRICWNIPWKKRHAIRLSSQQ